MESAMVSKGVALFATLIGIYNWIGQGTSLFDILVLIFAAALILRLDFGEDKRSSLPLEQGENPIKKTFFRVTVDPLRQFVLHSASIFNFKSRKLTPFYLFSFN